MAKEIPARAINPVRAAAEINLVQIELEDLLLGEFPLKRHRHNGFAQLTVERPIVVKKQIASKLLGNSRCAANPLVTAK